VVNLLSEDDMKNFTGTYYNEDYGTMEISIKGKTLAVKIGNLEGRITEPKKELLLAYMTAFKSKVEFETNRNDNKVISISLVSIPWPDNKFIKTK
jgi:hypothetical protein